jgi:propionyl-CoA synthetase
MIVTASFGIEPGRRVEYIPLVEKALELSSHSPSKVLIYNRPGMVRSIEIEYSSMLFCGKA